MLRGKYNVHFSSSSSFPGVVVVVVDRRAGHNAMGGPDGRGYKCLLMMHWMTRQR